MVGTAVCDLKVWKRPLKCQHQKTDVSGAAHKQPTQTWPHSAAQANKKAALYGKWKTLPWKPAQLNGWMEQETLPTLSYFRSSLYYVFFLGSLFYESFLSGAPTRLKLHCYQLIKLYRSKGRGFQMREWKQFLPERYLSRGDTELRFSQQQKNRLQTSRVARTRARTQTSRAGAGYARTQSCNAFIFEC